MRNRMRGFKGRNGYEYVCINALRSTWRYLATIRLAMDKAGFFLKLADADKREVGVSGRWSVLI